MRILFGVIFLIVVIAILEMIERGKKKADARKIDRLYEKLTHYHQSGKDVEDLADFKDPAKSRRIKYYSELGERIEELEEKYFDKYRERYGG